MPEPLRAGRAMIVGLCLAAAACAAPDVSLDQDVVGNWRFVESSGGFAGSGDGAYTADRIEITEAGELVSYDAAGAVLSTEPFSYVQLHWQNTGREERVMSLAGGKAFRPAIDDDRLTLEEDCCDRYSYFYQRIPDAPT